MIQQDSVETMNKLTDKKIQFVIFQNDLSEGHGVVGKGTMNMFCDIEIVAIIHHLQ